MRWRKTNAEKGRKEIYKKIKKYMLQIRKYGYGQFCLKTYDKKGNLVSTEKEIFNTEKEAQDFLDNSVPVEKVEKVEKV
jgi:hypothetical protein